MITLEKSVELPAEPEKVWAVVSDLPRWGEWLTIHKSWKSDVPAQPGPGNTVTGVASVLNMPNTITWTVDQWDAPRALTISGTGLAGAKIALGISVTAEGQATRLAVSAAFEGQMIVGAIAGAIQRASAAELDQSLANLSALVA
jgi:carbon monoxide dehydrogenase subunit G